MKRNLAKAVFYVAGLLSYIQMPHRYYRLVSMDPFITEPSGWHMTPCRLSIKMLKLSMQLDWKHWDHWATRHENCNPLPCFECGGCDCPDPPDQEASD